MPRLSTWFIRLALVHLVLGFTLGALMLIQKAGALSPVVWVGLPSHQDLLLVGFMLQLVFGVGAWILPRAPAPQSDRPLLIALVLINAGVWLSVVGSVIPAVAGLVALGRVGEVGAVVLFALHIWPRVRSFREAKA